MSTHPLRRSKSGAVMVDWNGGPLHRRKRVDTLHRESSLQGTAAHVSGETDLSVPLVYERTPVSTTHPVHTTLPTVLLPSKPAITPLHPLIDESRRTRSPLGKGAPLNIDNSPSGRGKRYIPGGWPVELLDDGHAAAVFPPLKRDALTGTYGGDASTEWTRKKKAVDDTGKIITRNTESTKEYVSKLDLDSSTRHYPGNPAFITTFLNTGGIDTTMVRPYPDQRPIRTSHTSGTIRTSHTSGTRGTKSHHSFASSSSPSSSLQQYVTDPNSVHYDNEGKWIDYDARIHGGIFGKRPPRTYDAALLRNPNEAADERGVEYSVTNIARGFREFGNSNQIGTSLNVPKLSAALASTSIYDTSNIPSSNTGTLSTSTNDDHHQHINPPTVSPMKLNPNSSTVATESSSPALFSRPHEDRGKGHHHPAPLPVATSYIESVGVHHNPAHIPPNSLHTSSLIGIETAAFRAQQKHTGKKLIPNSIQTSALDTASMIAKVPGENYAYVTNEMNDDEVEDSHNITKHILTEARLGKTTGRNTTSTMNATFYTFSDDVLKDNEDGPAFTEPLIPVTSSNDVHGITRSLVKFAAQNTTETLPPRVVNYTNGPTRAMVYMSGVEKDPLLSLSPSSSSSSLFPSKQRPATTNDGAVNGRSKLLHIPQDTGIAVRDSHVRAGIVSHVSPKPLIVSEIRQSMSGNVGGGHPVLSLTGAPYGKTMEGIYVRTDTETLAPKPSIPLANNTTAVSGWNGKNIKENDKQLDVPLVPIPLGMGPNRIGGAHIRNNLRLHTGIGTVSPTSILVVPSAVSVATGLTSRRDDYQPDPSISSSLSASLGVRNNLIPSPMRLPVAVNDPSSSSSPSHPFVRPSSSSPVLSRESLNDSPTNFIPSPSSSPLPSPSSLLDTSSVYSTSGITIPALQLPRDRSLDTTFSTVRFDPAPALPAAGRPSPVKEVAEQSKRTYRTAYTDVHDPRMVEFSALQKTQRTVDKEIDQSKLTTVRLTNEDPSSARLTTAPALTERKNKGIRNTDIHDAQIYATSALGYDAMRENLYGKEIAYSPEQLAAPRGSNLPFPLPTLVGLPYYIKRDAEINYHTTYHYPVPVDLTKPSPLRSTQVRYEPMTVRVVGNTFGSGFGGNSSGNGNGTNWMTGERKGGRSSEPKNYAAAIAQLQNLIKSESS